VETSDAGIDQCIKDYLVNLQSRFSKYVGYPESKFRWAIEKKKRIYFQTIYICITV
jgi:hypothetical protein